MEKSLIFDLWTFLLEFDIYFLHKFYSGNFAVRSIKAF